MVPRIIRIVLAPQDEWRRIAAEGWAAAAAHAAALALLPAAAAFAMQRSSELPLLDNAALATYAACLFTMAAVAAAFRALGCMFARRATWRGCFSVAVYGATPLCLASVLLAMPALVIVGVVSLLHVFYLYYVGAQSLLGVPEADAAIFVAMSLVLATAASTLAGAAAGAAGLL